MKILLVGGGSGGPVTPLLAVREEILRLKPNTEFSFISGVTGPEKSLMAKLDMDIHSIPCGKWRRYFSLRNVLDIFFTAAGFVKSLYLIKKINPDLVFSSGSYLAVPVSYAARLCGKKIVIHQQDYLPSLSNKLIYPIADKVTVSLEKSVKDYDKSLGIVKLKKREKAVFTGNPVRPEITQGSADKARQIFGLKPNFPTLLVLGGASGALKLNQIISRAAPELTKYYQIIHVTGRAKNLNPQKNDNYHCYEFLREELPHALKIADFVISRAGFSTISELSACKKVTLLVPLPDSHQLANAGYCLDRGAVLGIIEPYLTPEYLISLLRKIAFNADAQKILKKNIAKINPAQAGQSIAKILIGLCGKQTP